MKRVRARMTMGVKTRVNECDCVYCRVKGSANGQCALVQLNT
jgi:SH3-like domain-containing protein